MEKLTANETGQRLQEWVADNRINLLNVAGPRQSGGPAAYGVAN